MCYGKRKALCNEGKAADDSSNNGGSYDDGGVDTNGDDGGDGDVGDNNDSGDADKYDDGDDAVDCSDDGGGDNADSDGKYGNNHSDNGGDNAMIMTMKMMMILNTNFCSLIFQEFPLFLMRTLHFLIQLDVDDLYKITRHWVIGLCESSHNLPLNHKC